jgi:hypothetical protein
MPSCLVAARRRCKAGAQLAHGPVRPAACNLGLADRSMSTGTQKSALASSMHHATSARPAATASALPSPAPGKRGGAGGAGERASFGLPAREESLGAGSSADLMQQRRRRRTRPASAFRPKRAMPCSGSVRTVAGHGDTSTFALPRKAQHEKRSDRVLPAGQAGRTRRGHPEGAWVRECRQPGWRVCHLKGRRACPPSSTTRSCRPGPARGLRRPPQLARPAQADPGRSR